MAKPEYVNGNVRAPCPNCGGAITTYEHSIDGREFGTVIVDIPHEFEGQRFTRVLYMGMRCAGCGRGGLATIHDSGRVRDGTLDEFYPFAGPSAPLPAGVPNGIVREFREAELCLAAKATRGASALIRSVLEKALRANGYRKGSLADRIDEAAADGVITESRRKKAHDDIRVLGNDVLHDEWRSVSDEEVEGAHRYAQRVLEDLYDDRPTVEAILRTKKRI